MAAAQEGSRQVWFKIKDPLKLLFLLIEAFAFKTWNIFTIGSKEIILIFGYLSDNSRPKIPILAPTSKITGFFEILMFFIQRNILDKSLS